MRKLCQWRWQVRAWSPAQISENGFRAIAPYILLAAGSMLPTSGGGSDADDQEEVLIGAVEAAIAAEAAVETNLELELEEIN